ncbi:hypothetical protein HDV06_001667 [Boothiomyces sp. JEL0866]|nr:hypothetical protein HDV06_001667 [Boothiomyces sp. JEL0866]
MKFLLLAAAVLCRGHRQNYSPHLHGEDTPRYSYNDMDYSQYDEDYYSPHLHGEAPPFSDYEDIYSPFESGKKFSKHSSDIFKIATPFTKHFAQPAGNLVNKGGPVVSNIQVTPIFYGDYKYPHEMEQFYEEVVDSSYMDWLKEYNTNTQKIGRGKGFKGVYLKKTKATMTVKEIEELFEWLIEKNLIQPNPNSYYPIHLEKDVLIQDPKQKMCVDYCAYHSDYITKKNFVILYGILPICDSGCGEKSELENLMVTSSHELVETITDPLDSPLTWYDDRKDDKGQDIGEIADICDSYQGTVKGKDGKSYPVQMLWSNKENKCRL